MKYTVISTYAGATEEELEDIAHDIKIVGHTDDRKQMQEWAQQIFDETMEEDLDLFRDRYGEEELKERKEGFNIHVYNEHMIIDQERRQTDTEKPIIIGTLYNYNERRQYVDHIIIAAIKN